jgi:hypothetical protein
MKKILALSICLIFFFPLVSISATADPTFDDVGEEIGSAFDLLFGSDLLLGVFIFLVIMVLTFIFGFGMVVGSVVLIPSMFLVFEFIPSARIMFAIIIGIIVGLGLQKLIRR